VIERNGLKPVEASGDIVRFAREGAPIALVTPGVDDWRGVRWARVDGALDYLGASLADRPDLATGTILLHTLWMRVAAVDAVYLMRLELRDAAGRVVATHSRPLGYLVWPVADWPQDDTVLESYAWNPGVRLAPGRYSARMSLARLGSDVPPRVVAATTDALELGSFDVR
jgi:hypothetical protein